jgi:tetratricopeptide (TPR) repeat protein
MAEPRRAETLSPDPGARDRDSQADALLVQGLDHYFAGRYEEAIHVWTRVLFLDRSHARARAYIDRSRTALAERQRKSDELLQASQQRLDCGDTGAARDLLSQAVASTGDDERAAALRLKLERVERLSAPPPTSRLAIRPAPEIVPGWTWPRRSPAMVVVVATVAAGVLLLVGLTSPGLRDWMGFGSASETLTASTAPVKMPALSSSDVALIRARTLYGRGRLAEALQALDRVEDGSPIRQDADALRIEIQRLLLAGGQDRK